jgi:hypothetical protein
MTAECIDFFCLIVFDPATQRPQRCQNQHGASVSRGGKFVFRSILYFAAGDGSSTSNPNAICTVLFTLVEIRNGK